MEFVIEKEIAPFVCVAAILQHPVQRLAQAYEMLWTAQALCKNYQVMRTLDDAIDQAVAQTAQSYDDASTPEALAQAVLGGLFDAVNSTRTTVTSGTMAHEHADLVDIVNLHPLLQVENSPLMVLDKYGDEDGVTGTTERKVSQLIKSFRSRSGSKSQDRALPNACILVCDGIPIFVCIDDRSALVCLYIASGTKLLLADEYHASDIHQSVSSAASSELYQVRFTQNATKRMEQKTRVLTVTGLPKSQTGDKRTEARAAAAALAALKNA